MALWDANHAIRTKLSKLPRNPKSNPPEESEINRHAVSDQYFTGSRNTNTTTSSTSSAASMQSTKKQQLAAISNWFVTEKKHNNKRRSKPSRVRSTRSSLSSFSCHVPDEDRELLLPLEAVDLSSAVPDTTSFKADRSVDRQVSLPRVSSGSSYAGILYSGTTTLDGNFSGNVKESLATTRPVEEEEEEEEVVGVEASRDSLAQRNGVEAPSA